MNRPESRPMGSGTGTSGEASSGTESTPVVQKQVGASEGGSSSGDVTSSGGAAGTTAPAGGGGAPGGAASSGGAPGAAPGAPGAVNRGPGSPRPGAPRGPGSGPSGPRPGGGGGRPDRRFPPRQTDTRRINHQIRIRQIRVIDEEGKQLGVIETADALALALHKGLDLVEIAPEQRPPVCRIMDYGKFKYEEKKKQQASKRKQHQVQIKELRVRPKIAEHDVQVKVGKARAFIEDGDKVMIVCLFRGREMAHKEVGDQVIKHVFDLMKDVAKIESPTRMEGKRMVMLISKK